MRHRFNALTFALIVALSIGAAVAQSQRFQSRVRIEPNATYDGRFTFVRLRYPVAYLSDLDGMTHPDSRQAKAEYYGICENNDPARRLAVIINYNDDIGDYMEWSGEGWHPVNMSNDAYKLATNYIVYGLTH